MYVERVSSRRGEKTYTQVLLRESYREPGAARSQVKHRTLLNLTKYSEEEIAAIELGLKYKHDLARLRKLAQGEVRMRQGRSVGAVWLVHRTAERIGLVAAMGRSEEARRGLWQVYARLIEQGSRLSAVRLAQQHAACEILGLGGFTEESLYANLDWLDGRQAKIEDRLYRKHYGNEVPRLFLYDVTSSYLEGEQNAYGAYGYNRDGKKGKKQIVVGLLTDVEGNPVSVQVFDGNTQDPSTVLSQIRKMADRFGARDVTMVGDRGMIKSAQIEDLHVEGFHYLTAITKPQIQRLLKTKVLQLELFDEDLCEVQHEGVRYILRRNPNRVAEIAANREDKFDSLCGRAGQRNRYLEEHPRAHIETALRDLNAYAQKLRIDAWVEFDVEKRRIIVRKNEAALAEAALLDGCYVLKSDVPKDQADAKQLHARYKDLANVERAFRTMKTGHLEIRPVNVRTPAHTRAHVFVVMLAYRLQRELETAWRTFDITVEEGLKQLSTLCAVEVTIADRNGYLSIPQPREGLMEDLFTTANVSPPTTLPRRTAKAATKRKLPSRRKTH